MVVVAGVEVGVVVVGLVVDEVVVGNSLDEAVFFCEAYYDVSIKSMFLNLVLYASFCLDNSAMIE